MAQVTCNNCGLELPESEASPSMVGWLCAECAEARPESADIQQTYRNNALYSCVCAVVSYYFNPFAALTIAAVIFGVRALSYPSKLDDQQREYLAEYPWVKWVAAASIVAALAPLLIMALA